MAKLSQGRSVANWTCRTLGGRTAVAVGLIAALGAGGRASVSEAAIAGIQQVATGLNAPIAAAFAPGDRNRLFIAERGGTIRVLNLQTNTLETTPFLTIPSVDAAGEGGLLGLAFDPDFQNNHKFYVNVTIDNNGIVIQNAVSPFSNFIRSYTAPSATSNIANPTATEILNFVQPQTNHNGGFIGFSPRDNYLYILTGDGGGGNDLDFDGDSDGHTPGTGNAQDVTSNPLGKILRVDVSGDQFTSDGTRNYRIPNFRKQDPLKNTNPFAPVPDPANPGQFIDPAGDDEIWAYGLRNPFRAGFDRATGDLWIGDVGQSTREEIDRQLGASNGGENYGWRLREGLIQNPASVGGGKPPGNVDPVYDYPRTGTFGGTVVTGGTVYRGPDPTLQGKYFFADSNNSFAASDDKFWTFDTANPFGTVTDIKPLLTPNTGAPAFPVAFSEDAVGNLYIVYLNGNVYRITTNALKPGDFDADADVDQVDLAIWKSGFGTASGALPSNGDADGDGDVDGADFAAWQRNLGWSALNAATAASAAVAEPASSALGVIAVLLTACGAANRRSRLSDPA